MPASSARRGVGRRVPLAVALGTVAAVAAAAVLFPWLGPNGSAPVTPSPGQADASSPERSSAPASARQVLLAAAAEAEHQGVATPRRWQTRMQSATLEPVVGAGYLLELRWRDEYEFDPATGRGTWTRTELGARPARPADVAEWRRAGSPRSWQVTVPGPCPRDAEPKPGGCTAERTVSGEPSEPVSQPLEAIGPALYSLGSRNLTSDELARLPSDPARLKAELLDGFGGDQPAEIEAWLFENAGNMVTQMPVTPQVRAAAFRMLAELPGMTVVPAARDALGRKALAVTMRSGAYESRLFIDPDNWDGLAVEQRVVAPDSQRPWAEAGLRISYTAVEST